MAIVVESIGDKSQDDAAGTALTVDMPTGVAVGDLLVIHAAARGEAMTFTADSSESNDWTLIRSGTLSDNISIRVSYRIAEADDVQSSKTFTLGGTSAAERWARIYRISGHDATTPIDTSAIGSATSATVTVGTVTPTLAQSLFMFLIAADNVTSGAKTCSGYTMASDAPSYSEQYDETFDTTAGSNAMAAGATAVRSASSASGNNTATLTASDDNIAVIVVVKPEVTNVTVSPSVITLSASIQAPVVTAGANVSPTVISITASVQAPTVTIAPTKWSNTDKSSAPSYTNTPKS